MNRTLELEWWFPWIFSVIFTEIWKYGFTDLAILLSSANKGGNAGTAEALDIILSNMSCLQVEAPIRVPTCREAMCL